MNQQERASREGELLKGKYELAERLGSGGMGEVYRARNVLVDRIVAIKILHPELARDPNVVERFVREAKAANVVRHRNIVDVLDIDTGEQGVSFIVQEFLEGVDLAAHIAERGGRLEPGEALELLGPVAEAVGAAHARGLVHRDLKPENVLLALVDDEIVPKVLDFGISKFPLQTIGDGNISTRAAPALHSRLTAIAGAVGTPAYMSPEQIKDSGSVDARADVWALGVVLYEALSGVLPFDADTLPELFAKICTHEPTVLSRLRPELPMELVRVVHRALSPNLQQRFADGRALAKALAKARTKLNGSHPSADAAVEIGETGEPIARDATTTLPRAQAIEPSNEPEAGRRQDDAARSARLSDPVQWELAAPTPTLRPPTPAASQPGSKRSSQAPGAVSIPPSGADNDGLLDWDEVIGVPPVLELAEEPPRHSHRSSPIPAAVGLTPASMRPPSALGSRPPPSSRTPSSRTPSSRTPSSRTPSARPAPANRPSDASPARPPASRNGPTRSLTPERGFAAARAAAPAQGVRPNGAAVHGALSTAPSVTSSPPSQRVSVLTGSRARPSVSPGALVRAMLTATLIAALAWGAPTLSPVGMAWATQRFAAWAALPFAVAVLAGLVATAWMLARAGRGPSAPLLMSGAALLALTLATGTIAIALAAPGLVDHTWRAVALIAAPWAAMVALAGLALHAWLWSRQIPPGRMGHAVLRWALRAGTLGALAAAGWLALQPRASLEHIAATTVGPTEKAVADRAERVGVIVLGAERIAHALARTPTPKSPPPP